MLFSRSTEYALRAMTFLAMQPSGKLSGAREISQAESVPMPFLWKILQNLARRRLVRSFKGIRGGYQLARPSNQITLQEVVVASEGMGVTNQCVLGLPHCNEENACPLHQTWKGIRASMAAMLERNTLADLSQIARKRMKKK